MDFEKQKPITDEYRKGWERIWNPRTTQDIVHLYTNRCPMQIYRNGCPVLSESEPEPRTGPQRDDR